MGKKETTIRFNDCKTARLFARAARRRGYEARVEYNDVTVYADGYTVFNILKSWAINRGGMPTHIILG